VVGVGVGAREGHCPAVADRFRHRRRVVRGVGYQHLALLAEQPRCCPRRRSDHVLDKFVNVADTGLIFDRVLAGSPTSGRIR